MRIILDWSADWQISSAHRNRPLLSETAFFHVGNDIFLSVDESDKVCEH